MKASLKSVLLDGTLSVGEGLYIESRIYNVVWGHLVTSHHCEKCTVKINGIMSEDQNFYPGSTTSHYCVMWVN